MNQNKMTIQETIKKAIEQGYCPKHTAQFYQTSEGARVQISPCVFDDPNFWQCLGKAMGWEIMYRPYKSGSTRNFDAIQGWLYQWHRFIDHLAEGGTAEEFFNKLK